MVECGMFCVLSSTVMASVIREENMKLDERYKDVMYETQNRDDFLNSVKEAFPRVDWERVYSEFRAAGERQA